MICNECETVAHCMKNGCVPKQPAQQTCNCRWEGEVQVQQCTLHEAHVDAIHEWAERAKAAEAKLADQPAPVQQEPVKPSLWELLHVAKPAQQEPTCKQDLQVWVQRTGQFSWEPQDERFWTRMQPAHHTEQHLEMVANQPAQQEPSPGGVLFAVEEAIRNGDCPWQIEQAFDEYEAERKAAHNIKENT